VENPVFALPKEAVEEFQAIYEKEFGEKLGYAEASFKASKLVNLYQTIFSHKVNNSKEKVKKYGRSNKHR